MWNNYEIASGLDTKPDEVRKATLQVVMGQKCFRVLQNLYLTQAQLALASSVTIVNALNEYFLPKTNVTYERHKFNTRNQAHHERINEYVSALRHLVATCEFGNLKDDLIRYRIVLEIYDDNLRARLLRENELTLTQAIDFCRSFEQVKIQMKQMKIEQDVDTDVNEVTAITPANNVRRNNSQSKAVSCKFCGKKHKFGRKFAQHSANYVSIVTK